MIRIPRPFDVEEVACADAEERRFRSAHRHEIGVFDPECHLAWEVLLAVLRTDRGEEAFERGDVARRCGDRDPVIDGHEIGRQNAAA